MAHPRRTLALVAVFALGMAPSAAAQWAVTPYAGVNWGTAATFNDAALSYDDEFKLSMNVGAALTWTTGPWGVELDFGYLPSLFGDRKADDDFEFASNRALTMMANGLFMPQVRVLGMQPYAAGGIGVIVTHIEDEFEVFTLDSTNLAFNVGGGVRIPVGSRYSVRGDARYFRTIQEKLPEREVDVAIGSLEFWRFGGGFTIGF
jgi:opacity protein-like surface antigen